MLRITKSQKNLGSGSKNLEIKKGDIVKLKASANSQTAQSFVSLIIPILGAILGFFLGGFLANKFSLNRKYLP